VLLVDDSSVAWRSCAIPCPVGHEAARGSDGLKALRAQGLGRAGEDVCEKLLMVFTDAEMPEMDGYRLTTEIRNDPRLRQLYVVLHTSLSGSFNESVKKVGCDNFLSKFQPDRLVDGQQRLLLDTAAVNVVPAGISLAFGMTRGSKDVSQ
jgi:two-component system chemotaxis response regulator CheV